jgi:hypothetical protein
MGAETTVYVKVVREYISWIEVDAVTLSEAKMKAIIEADVTRVIHAQYNEPYSET